MRLTLFYIAQNFLQIADYPFDIFNICKTKISDTIKLGLFLHIDTFNTYLPSV
jgi:hypothetical protein